MNYINLKKKRFVGRNNQPIFNQFIIDYSTVEDVSFQIIDDKNQIQEITDTEGLYFAGSVGIGKQSYELLFLSKDYKVVDNIITFKVDTYTINYLNYIKKKNTEINIEIGQESLNAKKVILRDFALACPRVYVTGLAPQEIESKNYYTKTEVDELINDVYVPTKVSELQNDSGFISNYTETDPIFTSISGTLATKTYVNEAIPDISDMINANESILNVGGVLEDGTPKHGNVEINGIVVATHGSGLIVNNYFDNKELFSVFEHNITYKNEYDIERMKRADANSFTFESYTYFTLTSPITSINYSLPDGTLKNAVLQFTTGENITFTITGSSSYKINKPFNFEPNTSYIIYVDAYDIFWCKLQNFNQ